MTIRFIKMQGAGNDFVCLDAITEPELSERSDLGELAVAMCDRRRGIGGDGLLIMVAADPDTGAGLGMRMFNADGTESAMCGNGLRCIAKYALEHKLAGPGGNGALLVQTGAGVVSADCHLGDNGIERVTVDMGRPILDLAAIPVDHEQLDNVDGPVYCVRADDVGYEAVFVSMGNPHAAIYVDDVAQVKLAEVGPHLENHDAFPQRMNVHFVQLVGPGEAVVRTWERGSGITGACGSGACAVCVAGVLTGRSTRELLVHLPGGDLDLVWDQQADHVLMTGPAVEVFSGVWSG